VCTTRSRRHADANGNPTYDCKQFYQYDAWNRRTQVNEASALRRWAFHTAGVKMGTPYLPDMAALPSVCGNSATGWLLKHFNYDGVGRLYRTSSPLQAPEGLFFQIANPNPPPPPPATQPPYLYVSTLNRSERFFYDGTRRVQELITDPLLYTEEGDAITMANELYAGQPGSNVLVAGAPYVRAMYIWGPGDSPTSGVDELIVQIDPRDTGPGVVSAFGGKPWWALSDAQGDVIALLHKASVSATAEVAAQWTYSPYGEVLTYEQFHPHPVVVFGHKSLVVDRLDSQSVAWDTDLGTLSETQRLIPGATLIAYARNRTYLPVLGRWLQQDPNASGQAASSGVLAHGASPERIFGSVELRERLRDGPSLFGYVSQNPITKGDPTGLFIGGLLMPGPGDILMIGVRGLRGGLEEMLGQYAANQEADLDWALDWSMPDNIHSRMNNSWVSESFEAGLYGGLRDGLLDALDPTGGYLTNGPGGGGDDGGSDDPAMAGMAGSVARGASKLIGVSRKTYNLLKREYKANRMQYWKQEIRRDQKLAKNLQKYKPDQVKDVLVHGRAPRGKGGIPMEIHHHKGLYEGGTNAFGNLRFLEMAAHRGPGVIKDLHPGLYK
jgi:hypothetical protein